MVSVTDEAWNELKQKLRDRQQTLLQLIRETPDEAFDNEDMVGGAMAAIAHTAFHLGQVRHALSFIRGNVSDK